MAVSAEVWPWSMVDGEAEPETVRAGLTVTVTVAWAVPPSESVTSTQYVVVEVRLGVV